MFVFRCHVNKVIILNRIILQCINKKIKKVFMIFRKEYSKFAYLKNKFRFMSVCDTIS